MSEQRKPRVGVLLMNVGTPNSPAVSDVRKYLSQFLGDARVIDLPWLGRQLLVNGIIVPFRAPKSAKAYARLWGKDGSPLIVHGLALRDALRKELGPDHAVALAMRYQHPSITSGLDELRGSGVERIVLVPMFPQYASSSTGSALEEAFRTIRSWNDVPPVSVVPPFHTDEGYLQAFTEHIRAASPETFDHILFSFHGLPERHIRRSHTACSTSLQREVGNDAIAGCRCETEAFTLHGSCYKQQCHATARALATRCGLQPNGWSVGFQSRLDQRWIKPFSDQLIERFAREGKKRVLVVSPAFVADCLETVVEIGDEYTELFKAHGGQELQLVPSLNASATWVHALVRLVRTASDHR